MIGRAALVVACVLAAATADAAVTAATRIDPRSPAVGDTADLAVVVQGTQNAAMPRIPAVDGVRVQYVGPETQVAILNGQVTATVTHHFNVTAQRAGRFTLGPITVDADGRSIDAGTVVFDATPSAAAGDGDALALTMSTPRSSVWLHERVPVTVQLRVGAVNVTDVNYPAIAGEGFTVEPIPQPAQRDEQTADGTVHIVDFAGAVVPARAGPLTVGPASVSLAMVRQRGGHGFFLGSMRRETRTVASEPLVLDVRPLPEEGRPADFSGAVGRFALDATLAPLEVRAGDPVTLTLRVRGDGELGGAKPAGVAAQDGLRVYDVRPAAQQPGDAPGPPVARTFEQVLIPERPGTLTVPPQRFAYFDPAVGAYRVATAAPIALGVRPGTAETPRVVGAPDTGPAQDAAPLGRDLVYLKEQPGRFVDVGARPWRRVGFWLWQLVPLAGLGGVLAWDRRRRRLGGDERLARFSRAGRAARDGLAAARAALDAGDARAFYDRLAAAFGAYLGAKLDLPPGSVDGDAAAARVAAAGAVAAVVDDVRAVLAACEAARYAPDGGGDGDRREALAGAERVVRALERLRALPRSVAAAVAVLAVVAAAAAHADGPTCDALFHRGNVLYADGRFAEAAATYGEVRARGVESGALDYNQGNAWLRAGDAGRAVLAYERARRLLPRDPDVAANLVFARPANAAPPSAPWWARLAFPLAGVATVDELLGAAAAAWWIACALLAVSRLVPAGARPARTAAAVAGVVLLVAGTSAAWRALTVEARDQAVVVAHEPAPVRFEPSATATVHFAAPTGTLLDVVGARDGWLQVARADGRRGWVARDAVEPL